MLIHCSVSATFHRDDCNQVAYLKTDCEQHASRLTKPQIPTGNLGAQVAVKLKDTQSHFHYAERLTITFLTESWS